MTIYEKLKKVREINHISMNKMSKALGTTAPTYAKWEKGTARPNRKAINRLVTFSSVPSEIWLSDHHELPPLITLTIPTTPLSTGSGKADPDEPFQLRWRQFLMKLASEYDSQTELAELMGVDNPTLSRFLTGKKKLTRRTMFKIGTATGRYEWYEKPMPADHEGNMLRDYLFYKNIEQQEFAAKLGQGEPTVSTMLSKEEYKKSKWNDIERVLGVTKALIMKGVVPNSGSVFTMELHNSNKKEEETKPNEGKSRIAYTPERLKPLHHMSDSQYVTLRGIPGDARTGFNYLSMRDYLLPKTVSLHQLKEANRPDLSDAQQQTERDRYDVLIIGSTDYMGPGLQPGQEILIYRLHEDESELTYTAARWSDEQGVMAVQTASGRLAIGRVLENTLKTTGSLTFVTDDPRGGTFTVSGDQIEHLWKLKTYVDGAVV